MNKYFYPLICLILCCSNPFLIAQTREDFSDGNFTQNPVWSGDDSLFRVNNLMQLQSKGTAGGGEMALSTPVVFPVETEWRYWIRMAFNPSTQNHVRIYLCSDQAQLKGPLQGYYIQLGGSSGNSDSISLYRQNNTQRYCLIQGRAGTIGKSNNTFQLLIKRKQNGEWSLYTDTSSSQLFQAEGMAVDTHQINGFYSGMVFKYTSSNAQNFYFDQMYIGEPLVDKSAPGLLNARVKDSANILLQFNEPIAQPNIPDIQFMGLPLAESIQTRQNEISVHLSYALPRDTAITLQLNHIRDINGNALDTQVIIYSHLLCQGDLLITEWMADPDPPVGLPAAEFVELYNAGSIPLYLDQLTLKDAGSVVPIPAFVLQAKSFMLLCEPKDTLLFQAYGQTMGVPGFPSLNNSGDQMAVLDKQQLLLDQVIFDLSWYGNKTKEGGGWSIEMINPLQTCKGKLNYQASKSVSGGTPGRASEEWILQKDQTAPQLQHYTLIHPQCIQLQFDEAVQMQGNPMNTFHIAGIQIESVVHTIPFNNEFHIYLKDTLHHLQNYEIKWDSLSDCSGNTQNGSLLFTFIETQAPKQNELIMQEIYFDLNRKGSFPPHEFIELYNRSAYAIRTLDMSVSDGAGSYPLPDGMIAPGGLALLCHSEYRTAFAPNGNVLGLDHFPTLNNSDQITLRDSNGFVLHQVNYAESWLSQTAKVFSCSLEMTDTENPCGGKENWQASQDLNGATPGKKNSVNRSIPDLHSPEPMRVYVNNATTLTLTFNETLDSLSMIKPGNFSLADEREAIYFRYASDSLNTINMYLNRALDSGATYQLKIHQVGDCVQQKSTDILSPYFQIPQQPQAGELQFNEVLFNPKPDGYDFIEIFNGTEKTLDLSRLFVAGISADGQRQEVSAFGKAGWMAYPGEYCTLTENIPALTHSYFVANPNAVIACKTPAMNDDEGALVLLNERDEILDSFAYQSKMHLSFLNDPEGVSLEKINPGIPSPEAGNWTSAAEERGYATPTNRNSQYRIAANPSGRFACALPYFSPDGDGKEDFMTFTYSNPGDPGVGSLKVYDENGRCIQVICRSRLLGSAGEMHWNGEDETGQKAGIGHYLALFEFTEKNGSSQQFRICFSLLSR